MLSAILVEEKTENRFNKLMKDETGLSLVELLAVVVIIAILSGIGVIAIGNIIQNAREDAAISDVQTAYSAAVLHQSTSEGLASGGNNNTFTLADVNTAGLYNGGGFASLSTVLFTITSEGTLTMDLPAAALSAGTKPSVAITGMDQDAVSSLTRAQLFGSGTP
ncbi:pilus assembly FimT family protein [Enterococcus casseliflavus]|uniref:pilus assembly FimT family protein n=1 Tax=Enterococcus casseliflavus TaxID=37734 RepID=UPI002DB74D0E|nr:prepilin-type N-terminal cleavage/methylation domain-containing protein [Enterococcus casseliflavus]MEB8417849.1 prepilin-type N-terminal cleavage/methylation domain-containing protein [Enterococcus casseliflavus]